ncbi:WD40-repeat-containing domain protein [Dissophora ornata]|nr:WD40-repeat-containing domain protein [Dissophora ornata]
MCRFLELAVQLLKSVSPSVFTKSYARLTPLFEYRDFLVLLPYELTVHLLSFLDEKSLATVALVSKAWNKCASDNTVWKGLYLKHGWKVNQDMVDWYLRWADLEEQWLLGPKGMHPRIHFESESSLSRGKRKMMDHHISEATKRECDDYDMMEHTDPSAACEYQLGDNDEETVHSHLGCFPSHPAFPEYALAHQHSEDIDMAPTPEDDYDSGSSPISMPSSSPTSPEPFASPERLTPPEQSPAFESGDMFAQTEGSSSSMRASSSSQRHGRFSLSNTAFIPSIHRPRMPMYALGSSLMTPPSMLKKISNRPSPPSPLRIPNFQGGGSSSSPSASSSRPSRFFGHQRSNSADQARPDSQPISPTTPVSPKTTNNNIPSGPHSPLTTKSLWSVIRHGVMGVSGSSAWPSLHPHRNTDSNDHEHSSSSRSHPMHQFHHHHHLSPSLPAWLMHLPSPLTSASSRYHRSSNSQHTSPAATSLPGPSVASTSSNSAFDSQYPPIPKRIDYLGPNAPLPAEILSPGALKTHRHPITKRPMINWKFLCQQRKVLERNWNRGDHFPKELPGHTEGIYCIQFDDQKIISGSRDNTIKIWDLATGVCLRTYLGHTASVLCLQYDEDRIVSGSSDTTIIVWDLETGQVLRRLAGHADSVLSLRFEKDIVVSCSKDRTVKIWNISTGDMIRTLVGHRAAVNAVQFSPESAAPSPFLGSRRVVVSASGDKTIKIWSFETGECLRTLEGHARGIACIQFEGNLIVSGSSDRSIKIWDVARAECVKTLTGHDGLVRTLQFSGGRIISGGYDETLKIWDQETGKLLADMEGRHSHRVFKLQFNDSKIVSCSQDQKIIIWDFAVGVDMTFLT